jgi:tRNA (cytidine/uridine-2'-O-)-methyltransferase
MEPIGKDMDSTPHRTIQDAPLHIVLFQPEIPANTGNIARLCGAAEITLHLIHPLGFRVDDRHLKRAGLDYWPVIDVRHHDDFPSYLEATGDAIRIAFSRHAKKPYTDSTPSHGDHLLFGPETRGLPREIRQAYPCRRIPIWGRVRSLNLSTSAGIAAYHWLHAMGRF